MARYRSPGLECYDALVFLCQSVRSLVLTGAAPDDERLMVIDDGVQALGRGYSKLHGYMATHAEALGTRYTEPVELTDLIGNPVQSGASAHETLQRLVVRVLACRFTTEEWRAVMEVHWDPSAGRLDWKRGATAEDGAERDPYRDEWQGIIEPLKWMEFHAVLKQEAYAEPAIKSELQEQDGFKLKGIHKWLLKFCTAQPQTMDAIMLAADRHGGHAKKAIGELADHGWLQRHDPQGFSRIRWD